MSSGIERILFATDFSECSTHALQHAIQWAQDHDASLDCVHVLNLHAHLEVEGAVIEMFIEAASLIGCFFDFSSDSMSVIF